MAVSTVTNRIEYQGNGSSAVFNFPYPIHSQSHIAVFVYNSSGVQPGYITPQVLNTDYVLSGTANAQGIYPSGINVIMNSSPNAQANIVIFRSSVVTNNFSIGQNGNIPSTGLNQEMDYLTLITQRLQDQATRSVRMPDGLAGTFDPTLPQNLMQSAGKRLIVNSACTGFTFDETIGNFTPNTLIYAQSNSTIASLGGAPAGLFIQSQGSSAPAWVKINVGSSEQIAGILPTTNGGTGIAGPYLQNAIIFASSTNQMSNLPQGAAGLFLQSNGSSAPSWQSAPGGASGPFTQFGVAFASSLTQVTSTQVGGTDIPLLGIAGQGPAFKALPLGSSSISGTLATSFGGTGVAGPFIQYGVIVASSATQMTTVPSAASGLYLQSNGSSAPSWGAGSLKTIATKSAAYSALNTDDVVMVSSSGYIIQTWGPVGNSGRLLTIQKSDSTNTSGLAVTIQCSATFIAGVNNYKLFTTREAVTLFSDGSSLLVAGRYFKADLGVQTWSSNESNATVTAKVTRTGQAVRVDGYALISNSCTFPGSGFFITIPTEFTPDATVSPVYGGIGASRIFNVGTGQLLDANGSTYPAVINIFGSSSLRVQAQTTSAAFDTNAELSGTSPYPWTTGDYISFSAEWIVTGWF